ncbi:hypothetical protein, partial [Escherichia coli]
TFKIGRAISRIFFFCGENFFVPLCVFLTKPGKILLLSGEKKTKKPKKKIGPGSLFLKIF